MSASSLPLSRIRASGSSCHVTSSPPSIETDSSAGFASSCASSCSRRCAPAPPIDLAIRAGAKRTPPTWMRWRADVDAIVRESRAHRRRDRRRNVRHAARSRICSCAAIRWRSRRCCPPRAVIIQAAPRTRSRRSSVTARCVAAGLRASDRPVPSVPSWRLRPGSLATDFRPAWINALFSRSR